MLKKRFQIYDFRFTIFWTLLIASCLLLIQPFEVSAHEDVTENGAEILLHIDPEDKPVANKQTTFHFSVVNADSAFSIDKCDCEVYVDLEGNELFVGKVTSYKGSSIYDAYIPYKFTKAGNYKVHLVAKPNDNSFDPFDVHFKATVTPEASLLPQIAVYFLAICAAFITVGLLVLLLTKGKFKEKS